MTGINWTGRRVVDGRRGVDGRIVVDIYENIERLDNS